jgi:hypothetical protein
VTRISVTKPTLDEVYLEYTGRAFRDDEDPSRVWAQRMTMRELEHEQHRERNCTEPGKVNLDSRLAVEHTI